MVPSRYNQRIASLQRAPVGCQFALGCKRTQAARGVRQPPPIPSPAVKQSRRRALHRGTKHRAAAHAPVDGVKKESELQQAVSREA